MRVISHQCDVNDQSDVRNIIKLYKVSLAKMYEVHYNNTLKLLNLFL